MREILDENRGSFTSSFDHFTFIGFVRGDSIDRASNRKIKALKLGELWRKKEKILALPVKERVMKVARERVREKKREERG